MDFGSSGKEGLNEEEKMAIILGKAKFPFSYSSSSSPSSSSSRAKSEQLTPLINSSGREEQQQQPKPVRVHSSIQIPSTWLSNRYEPEEVTTTTTTTTASEADSGSTRSVSAGIEKEHMFDKVVTPSDVGKLNRLVIPKHNAEKHFPMDSSTNEKGLLLTFEDQEGKRWKFRYSYWNSSQSYVMTKGWSRFVRDKKLDAGDTVSFHRGVGEMVKDRLFINWRRKPAEAPPDIVPFNPHQHLLSFSRIPWNPLLMRPPLPLNYPPFPNSYYGGYPTGNNTMGSLLNYITSAPPQLGMGMMHRQGSAIDPIVIDSVPVVQAKAAASPKRLRLFGVNMECPVSESDECEMLPTSTIPHASTSSSQDHHNHLLELSLSSGTPSPPSAKANKGKASLSFDLDI